MCTYFSKTIQFINLYSFIPPRDKIEILHSINSNLNLRKTIRILPVRFLKSVTGIFGPCLESTLYQIISRSGVIMRLLFLMGTRMSVGDGR